MASPPKPWWHRESGEYRAAIRGQRRHLGADKDEAQRSFHELMAQRVPPPQRPAVSIVGFWPNPAAIQASVTLGPLNRLLRNRQ